MANAIPTGLIDKNRKPVYTGQVVRMNYTENVIEGIVRVRGYRYRNRLFCVETKEKIRYPFELMKKPSKQIEVIKDYSYAKDRLD